jgi:hypothetical protein
MIAHVQTHCNENYIICIMVFFKYVNNPLPLNTIINGLQQYKLIIAKCHVNGLGHKTNHQNSHAMLIRAISCPLFNINLNLSLAL